MSAVKSALIVKILSSELYEIYVIMMFGLSKLKMCINYCEVAVLTRSKGG
jgi:hypothetical protein